MRQEGTVRNHFDLQSNVFVAEQYLLQRSEKRAEMTGRNEF